MALTILYYLSLLAFSQARNARPLFDPRIVNGDSVKLGEIPYQVSIQESGSHICGGVIIDKYLILTTTNCLIDKSPLELKVIAGTNNLKDPNPSIYDSEIIQLHEKNIKWFNDIALLKVTSSIEISNTINFVKLPEKNITIKDNDKAVVSGWGTLWHEGPRYQFLQQATVVIVNQTVCKEKYKGIYDIQDSHICAYDPNVGRGPCDNDQGGPLTLQGTLIGLVSGIQECGSIDYPAIYTRVSSYLEWIEENKDLEEDPELDSFSNNIDGIVVNT